MRVPLSRRDAIAEHAGVTALCYRVAAKQNDSKNEWRGESRCTTGTTGLRCLNKC
jgi:hypothetical protein